LENYSKQFADFNLVNLRSSDPQYTPLVTYKQYSTHLINISEVRHVCSVWIWLP